MPRVKIAIPTEKGGLDDVVYDRLGRAPTFTVVEADTDTGEIVSVQVIRNPGYEAGSGAGVKAAEAIANAGAQVYAGPNPGPNAYAALQYFKIKVMPGFMGLPVKEAVKKIIEELKKGE
jgi:predicted Fe-Mo cluster-binding NifX family protein